MTHGTPTANAPVPKHSIGIIPNPDRVRVVFCGHIIADTTRALELSETHHPPVQYIPRGDVDMTALQSTTHATHCPHKGGASYFSIVVAEHTSENAVWSYERPLAAVESIAGHLAFYAAKVDEIEIIPA